MASNPFLFYESLAVNSGIIGLLDKISAQMETVSTQASAAKSVALASSDDIAALSSKALGKAAGVVGDDVAVNVESVAGHHATREIPVVWSVAKGSVANKALLIPVMLGLSFVAPPLLTGLMIGGSVYLAHEGGEKLIELLPEAARRKLSAWKLIHGDDHQHGGDDAETSGLSESERIQSAIRTDLVLSGEILLVTMGGLEGVSLLAQAQTMAAVGAAMTVGVYGVVAGIVKLDDLGLWLQAWGRRTPAEAERHIAMLDALWDLERHDKQSHKTMLSRVARRIKRSIAKPMDAAMAALIVKAHGSHDSAPNHGAAMVLKSLQHIGGSLVAVAPKIMKYMTWAGTIAMFSVGGGMLAHSLHLLAPGSGFLMEAGVGLASAVGTMTLSNVGSRSVAGFKRMLHKRKHAAPTVGKQPELEAHDHGGMDEPSMRLEHTVNPFDEHKLDVGTDVPTEPVFRFDPEDDRRGRTSLMSKESVAHAVSSATDAPSEIASSAATVVRSKTMR